MCERLIGTIRRKCLDHTLILGLATSRRSSPSTSSTTTATAPAPSALETPATQIKQIDPAMLRRTDRLGGLIHEYQMVA
jgi:hypothetical protein